MLREGRSTDMLRGKWGSNSVSAARHDSFNYAYTSLRRDVSIFNGFAYVSDSINKLAKLQALKARHKFMTEPETFHRSAFDETEFILRGGNR